MTLSKLIKKALDDYPQRIFLVERGMYRRKEYTYSQIFERASAICGYFEDKKIKKGDKVIVYLPNSPDYVSILWACALSGVIAVPIDFNNSTKFVEIIMKKVNAKKVFSSLIKQVGKKELFAEELPEIYQKYSYYHVTTKIDSEDIFEIVYTSGTTSEPKGVVLTNQNLVSNIESIEGIVNWNTKGFVLLSLLPLSHLFEQNIGMFLPMSKGMSIVYTQSRKSSEIMSSLNDEGIRMMVSVPLFLQTVMQKIEKKAEEKGKLEDLRNAIKKYADYPLWFRKIIFRKIRNSLGSLEYVVSG